MPAIDKFKQQVNSQGILRGNRYNVKLFPPLGQLISAGGGGGLESYASAVSVPGRDIETMERPEFGETRLIAHKHTAQPDDTSNAQT